MENLWSVYRKAFSAFILGTRKNELRSRLIDDVSLFGNKLVIDVNYKGLSKIKLKLKTRSAKKKSWNLHKPHQFVIPDGQVALLELFTGVGCPVLYQLIVVRQNTPSMISGTFGTCSDLGKLSHDAKGFTLDLPGNPREMWIWDNEHLNVFKNKLKYNFLWD